MDSKIHDVGKRDADYSLLTPITVPTGVKPSPQRGNLTGIPRKIRDNCAELYNLIQEWNTLNTKGVETIQAIGEAKVQKAAGSDIDDDNTQDTTPRPSVDLALVQLCDNLLAVYQSMVSVTQKMKQIREQFRHIETLNTMHSPSPSQSASGNQIIFQTWSAKKFCETSVLISSMFDEELRVKNGVVESVAHINDPNDLLFLSALWVHEPMLKPELVLHVEAMLVETGLR